MISSTKRRLVSLGTTSAMIAVVAVATAPTATMAAPSSIKYFNGFESAANTTETKAVFEVARIDERTTSIDAAAGRWYAAAPTGGEVFTRQGGYSRTFPTKGYTTSVDIYLDVAKATGPTDLRFDWSSAVNKPDGTHKRDFIFHVGSYAGEAGKFYVSASNNAPGDPKNGLDPLVIEQSGWYTLKHEFINDGGVLAVEMNLIPRGGQSVATWTLRTETDAIGGELGEVGGNRNAWLVNNSFEGLALDNITRVQN